MSPGTVSRECNKPYTWQLAILKREYQVLLLNFLEQPNFGEGRSYEKGTDLNGSVYVHCYMFDT
jgi:hypothetical protein